MAFRAALRTAYKQANPFASEADYERVADRLFDEVTVRRTLAGLDVEAEGIRQRLPAELAGGF
jgi:hypothetical protein